LTIHIILQRLHIYTIDSILLAIADPISIQEE